MANEYIRAEAKKHGVYLWEVARYIGISDTTMSKHMRNELPSDERTRIERAIYNIAYSRKQEG